MRSPEWQRDMRDALRRESWSLSGPTRPVKVVSLKHNHSRAAPESRLAGYICQEKVLLGRTPAAIESLLGLPRGELVNGCRIYRFRRLPGPSEVEYDLTARHPGGLAYTPTVGPWNADGDPVYPPGSNAVHQWRLLVDVPVEHLLDLAPGVPYRYMHGR